MLFAVSMRVRPLNLETPKVAEEVEAPLKKVPVPVQLEQVKQLSIETFSWKDPRRPWLPWLPWFLCKHGQNRLLDVAILKAQAAQGEGQRYAAGIRNCHVPALGSTASGQPSGAKPAGRTATAQGSTGFGLEMGAKLKYYMGSCWIHTASWIGILQNSKYFQMHLDSFTLVSPCKGRDLLCQESRSWPGW